MRHLAIKLENGVTQSTWGCGDSAFERRVAKMLTEKPAGLYRMTVTMEGNRSLVWIGKRCQSVEAERARLEKVVTAKPHVGGFRTGMPGVQGFQHYEDMTNASAIASRRRTNELIEWLQKIEREGVQG